MSQLSKLDKANEYNLGLLTSWLLHEEGGDSFLRGVEYDAWDERNIEDLVTISSRASSVATWAGSHDFLL